MSCTCALGPGECYCDAGCFPPSRPTGYSPDWPVRRQFDRSPSRYSLSPSVLPSLRVPTQCAAGQGSGVLLNHRICARRDVDTSLESYPAWRCSRRPRAPCGRADDQSSASVFFSASDSNSRPLICALRIRFSAARYSLRRRSSGRPSP